MFREHLQSVVIVWQQASFVRLERLFSQESI